MNDMFNFIFDGKIGEILAPVVPTNKLFLAIQHHKNDEVQQLMLNNDIQRNADGGYAAVHVACRYNNKVALEMILARGVPVESVDQHGNSPLHYACKYGHLDICKYLIEQRASPCRKNSSGETPYDVAGAYHTVRQYMLPLQFQAERGGMEGHSDPNNGMMGISNDAYYNSANGYGQTGYGSQQSAPTFAPPPQQQQYSAPPPAYYSAPTVAPLGVPPAADGTAAHSNPSPTIGAAFAPPVAHFTPAAVPPGSATGGMYNHARPAGSAPRIIQPDGFHTSASDPVLQKKYGHTQQVINIAPPPTGAIPPGGAAPYNMYSMQSAPGTTGPVPAGPPGSAPPPMGGAPAAYGAPGVYSRYVAYDAHNNTAAPLPSAYGGPPAAAHSASSSSSTSSSSSMLPQFLGGARPGLPTHVSPSPVPNQVAPLPVSVGQANRTLTASNPAATSAAQPLASGSVSPVGLAAGNSTPVTGSASGSVSGSAPNSQRLLGNKAPSGGEDLFNSTRSGLNSHSGEEEVIITGSSSAVL